MSVDITSFACSRLSLVHDRRFILAPFALGDGRAIRRFASPLELGSSAKSPYCAVPTSPFAEYANSFDEPEIEIFFA